MMNHRAATDYQRVGDQRRRGFLASPTGWVLLAFLALVAFYLVTEHQAHLYGVLPWLLLLACPLMHFFMHRGHSGHRHGEHEPKSDDR